MSSSVVSSSAHKRTSMSSVVTSGSCLQNQGGVSIGDHHFLLNRQQMTRYVAVLQENRMSWRCHLGKSCQWKVAGLYSVQMLKAFYPRTLSLFCTHECSSCHKCCISLADSQHHCFLFHIASLAPNCGYARSMLLGTVGWGRSY